MKCQHCGVHFDDTERECPICGARAGSRGRMSVPHYTGYNHKKHDKKSCTHTTYTEKKTGYTGSVKKGGAAAGRKKKGKAGLIIALVVVMIQLFPLLGELTENVISSAGIAVESITPKPEPDMDGGLQRVLGAEVIAFLPDGMQMELRLEPGQFGAYTMTMTDGETIFEESGEAWCMWNEPDEWYSEIGFPPEQYERYSVCLTAEQMAMQGGRPGDALSAHIQQFADNGECCDLWLELFVEQDGREEAVFWDYEETGLFGEAFIVMSPAQQG